MSMQKYRNPSPCVPSPSRKLHNGLANKRVELIKNTELNIELALSKSRNSQPELQSGSIKDLEHTSPKRQFTQQPCSPIHRFLERNTPAGAFAPKEPPPVCRQPDVSKCSDSPVMPRRTTPHSSPSRSLMQHQVHQRARNGELESNECSRTFRVVANCNGNGLRSDPMDANNPLGDKVQASPLAAGKKEFRGMRGPTKEEGVTSSSSDSEEKCDVKRRAPLMTFRSVGLIAGTSKSRRKASILSAQKIVCCISASLLNGILFLYLIVKLRIVCIPISNVRFGSNHSNGYDENDYTSYVYVYDRNFGQFRTTDYDFPRWHCWRNVQDRQLVRVRVVVPSLTSLITIFSSGSVLIA